MYAKHSAKGPGTMKDPEKIVKYYCSYMSNTFLCQAE